MPNIQADLIVGSSEGDQFEPLKILEELLKKQYENESPAVLRSKSDNEQVISFYLDATAFTEWQAMVFDGSEYRLMVESKYVVITMSYLSADRFMRATDARDPLS